MVGLWFVWYTTRNRKEIGKVIIVIGQEQDRDRTGQDRNVSGMDDRSIGEGIDNQEKKNKKEEKRYQAVEC